MEIGYADQIDGGEKTLMITGFENIVEERIRKAQKEGIFNDLPGAGAPLPDDAGYVPEDIRLAYKILKNADCLPPELELRKEIRHTEDLLDGMEETAEKYRMLRKLNLLVMKLNTMRRSSAGLDVPQRYMGSMAERLGSASSCAGVSEKICETMKTQG